jgi:hypothetical protein
MEQDGVVFFDKNRTQAFVRTPQPSRFPQIQNIMIRIAIAGSGGLAQTFAYFISQTTHPFIILSRTVSDSTQSHDR